MFGMNGHDTNDNGVDEVYESRLQDFLQKFREQSLVDRYIDLLENGKY